MHPIGSFSSSTHKNAPPDRRRAERRKSPELAAYLWNGSMQQQAVHFCQHGSGGEVLTRNVHEFVGATWNDQRSMTEALQCFPHDA